MISEIENLTWVIVHRWRHVTDEVRALFDGGWRAEDGAEALVEEYEMTAEEAESIVLGLEVIEAIQKIRARADAIEAWLEATE